MSSSKSGPVPKRWVIKLGTGILSDSQGHVDLAQIEQLAAQVAELRRRGHEMLVVSSGAVGCGMSLLGLTKRPTQMAELQACAALGQPRLMRLYDEAFGRAGIHVAQVLLTHDDLRVSSRSLGVQETLRQIIAYGAMVHAALEAAAGIEEASVRVLDLRTLVPLDERAILDAVRDCAKVVVVDEANYTCAPGAQVASLIAQYGYGDLDGPVVRVATPDAPIPFAPALEHAALPGPQRIRDACRELLAY